MPSSCYSTITLIASSETIQELFQNGFDPEVYLPTPPSVGEEDMSWISWRYAHWGTKRIYSYKVLQKGVRGMRIKITTARGPPTLFFRHLLEKFPDLFLKCEFTVDDGYSGIFIGKTGEEGLTIIAHSWEDLEHGEFEDALQGDALQDKE
jgi:hypothetical protein